MSFSIYYQAKVEKERTWLVTGALRSFEHLAIERTIDTTIGTLEFFVAPDLEPVFLDIMNHFKELGIVSQITKLPNRLEDPTQQL